MTYRIDISSAAKAEADAAFLRYGKGKHTYRILFTILDDQTAPTVRILHIRNTAQKTLGE